MVQFRKDLAAAGISYLDAQGKRADFHALRHTLATNLARCGVRRAWQWNSCATVKCG